MSTTNDRSWDENELEPEEWPATTPPAGHRRRWRTSPTTLSRPPETLTARATAQRG